MRRSKTLMIVLLTVISIVTIYSLVNKLVDRPPVIGDSEIDRLSVRMKWFYAGTMTGWFAGKSQGLFKEQKIDLNISPGGPDNNSVKLVAAGTDQFGVAGADEVLLSREKGIPVVAIAVLFKDSPLGFISKKAKGITSPAQWTGKTIEVSYGSNAEVQYRAILKKYGVTDIKEVPYTYSLAPFVSDRVDVSVAYVMDQVITLQNMGVELDVIAAKNEGINPYGDVIITTEKLLNTRPELVKRFLRAALGSQRWAIENPEAAVKALVFAVPELKQENELKVWESSIPFLLGNGSIMDIGKMELDRWIDTYTVLKNFGFVKEGVDIRTAFIDIN